ncbi:MAG: hypothetical protein JW727_00260 [Candidatus Aenigmarchaeota archaeon]|nr:hypothetical protein [Candidatus Aenigmarchaeota archaeon]
MESCYLKRPKYQESSGSGVNLAFSGSAAGGKFNDPITPKIMRERWWGMGPPEKHMNWLEDITPEEVRHPDIDGPCSAYERMDVERGLWPAKKKVY